MERIYLKKKAKKITDSSMISAIQDGDLTKILNIIVNNPMSHVNRIDFLSKNYGVSEYDILNENFAISLDKKKALAKKRIRINVRNSTSLSFVSGLPGGIALAGTIPADIAQNMVISIRLIQELAYIYGYEEIISQDGELKIDGLILFLGIMFSAQSAGALLRVATRNAATFTSKKIMTTALTKTAWYPLLKNISKVVAKNTLTKKTLAISASKAIPVIGGVVSGGITSVTMNRAAKRLNKELIKGDPANYNEERFNEDIGTIEVDFEEIDD